MRLLNAVGLSFAVIPDSVTRIGTEAFGSCVGLKSIKIPNSLVAIDSEAFKGCTGLATVTLPKKITTLGEGAFSKCSALASINLPISLTAVARNVFEGCTALTSMALPTSIKTIGGSAFQSATNLVVTIKQPNPSQITSVNANAFDDVKGIRVPKSSLNIYQKAVPWSKWKDKMVSVSSKELYFDGLFTYKKVIPPGDILAQVRELSGAFLGEGYSLKRISNIKALSGGSDIAEVSGISIKIKKQAGIFTADLVLQHPLYLDMTITGALFQREEAFIFDDKEKAIIGVTPKYANIFSTATEITFPDQINGINVEEIRGDMENQEMFLDLKMMGMLFKLKLSIYLKT